MRPSTDTEPYPDPLSPASDPQDEEEWFRPAWDGDDEAEGDLAPSQFRSGTLPRREATEWRAVLLPLSRAQDAVARLEAALDAASAPVAEGLRARMAYREASGWLAQCGAWIHPLDLALRDINITGSVNAALIGGRLRQTLPVTAIWRATLEDVPDDQAIARGLTLARVWRRLAELRTWRPLADAASLGEALALLGVPEQAESDLTAWLDTRVRPNTDLPVLIVAAEAALDWQDRQGRGGDAAAEGVFLAACLWRAGGFGRLLSLPFWSAPPQRLNHLALRVGADWLPSFLDCVAEAAQQGRQELHRLQRAERTAATLARTARSHVPAAVATALRRPAVTARMIADELGIAPQSALILLKQLVQIGALREMTGKAAWRAFTVA